MKIIYIFSAIFLTFFLLTNCEDPIDLEVPDGDIHLVVDGFLTDQSGKKSIHLSQTQNYFDQQTNPPIGGAQITLYEDEMQVAEWEEMETGIYGSDFQGQTGRTYFIEIEANGKFYRSTPELMKPVSEITDIRFKYKEKADIDGDAGYYVYIDTYEPETKGDFYRWKTYLNGHYQNKAYQLYFATDEFVNGNPILDFEVSYDPIELGDHFRVEQHSISEAAYEFFSGIELVAVEVGSLFDPPPTTVKGNMYNVQDPDEEVLGFFGVSAVSESEIVIE